MIPKHLLTPPKFACREQYMAVWPKHANDCFDAGASATETSLIKTLRKAVATHKDSPQSLAAWLTGFTKHQPDQNKNDERKSN